jgi:alanine racemase
MEFPLPVRPTVLTVDLDRLRSNLKTLSAHAGGTPVLAVVKANGYGSGALPVARAALEAGAAWLGVALVAEGLQLRAAGISVPILLLGPAAPEEAEVLLEADLTPAVYGQTILEALECAAARLGRTARAHLKVDSGMGRLGLRPEDLAPLLEAWKGCPHVILDGVFTNFASADDPASPQNDLQRERFLSMVAAVRESGFSPAWIHMANSAALLSRPDARLTLLRPGITLYGMRPSEALPDPGLELVLSLTTRLIQVKDLPPETPVGYGATFVTGGKSRVGILPVGYADGLPRSLSGQGYALVRGARCPIVGRVSMDLTAILLDNAPGGREGDTVTLWGTDGPESLGPWDWARWAGTIPYEITTGLSARVGRKYISHGREQMDWPLAEPGGVMVSKRVGE